MQTTVENLGQLARRMDMSVPVSEIDREVEQRLKRLARTAKLHGFRPGKVPFKVVVQQYGYQVRSEVIGDAVQRAFTDSVRTQNLRVAGFPKIEAKEHSGDSAVFEFSATF